MGGQAVDLGLEGVNLLFIVRFRDCFCHRFLRLGQKLVRLQIGSADLPHLLYHCLGDRLLFDCVAGADTCFCKPLVGSADKI